MKCNDAPSRRQRDKVIFLQDQLGSNCHEGVKMLGEGKEGQSREIEDVQYTDFKYKKQT